MADETDMLVEQLECLLDRATTTMRDGDAIGALVLLEEALATAEKLPKRPPISELLKPKRIAS